MIPGTAAAHIAAIWILYAGDCHFSVANHESATRMFMSRLASLFPVPVLAESSHPVDTSLVRLGKVEIIRVAPRLAVETRVRGECDVARKKGLQRLHAYLRHANDINATLTLAETIIQHEEGQGLWRIRVLLPRGIEPNAMPQQPVAKVDRVMVRSETLAVLRLKGSTVAAARRRAEVELRSGLDGAGWVAEGPARIRLHSTWPGLWFLRRCEIAIPVRRATYFG